jgi:hypothetical protein
MYIWDARQYQKEFSSLKKILQIPFYPAHKNHSSNPMDPTLRDDIRSRLQRYDRAVQAAGDPLKDRSSFGRYRAGDPYFEQYALRVAFDIAAASGAAVPEEFRKEYDKITRELASPACGGSRAYREELCRDLHAYVEVYRTVLCCQELGMGDVRTQTGPLFRAEIGILLAELAGEFPLADLAREVQYLDAALAAIHEAGPARTAGDLLDAGVPDPVSGSRILQRKKGQAGAR